MWAMCTHVHILRLPFLTKTGFHRPLTLIPICYLMIVLAAHYDVVPADPKKWIHQPFGGSLTEQFVHGRGTLDDKSRLIAILQSLDTLLRTGFKPQRSFYLVVAHNEEVDGHYVRRVEYETLGRRSDLLFILSQGTPILENFSSLATTPVALIGVGVKGHSIVRLTTGDDPDHLSMDPDHSLMPPPNPSIVRLARAIKKLEASPHPIKLDSGYEKFMAQTLFPSYSGCFDKVLANKESFLPALTYIADRFPFMNAMLRTTTAFTIVQGGNEKEIIPDSSTVVMYHSIYPSDKVDTVRAHDEKVINDKKIKYQFLEQSEPSAISPYDSNAFGYQAIKKVILDLYPNIRVGPGLAVGGADTSYYIKFSGPVYRFSPYFVTLKDIETIHGDDEEILEKNFYRLLDFYYDFIQIADKDNISSFEEKNTVKYQTKSIMKGIR